MTEPVRFDIRERPGMFFRRARSIRSAFVAPPAGALRAAAALRATSRGCVDATIRFRPRNGFGLAAVSDTELLQMVIKVSITEDSPLSPTESAPIWVHGPRSLRVRVQDLID